jgi:hypothetical protein
MVGGFPSFLTIFTLTLSKNLAAIDLPTIYVFSGIMYGR